MTWDTLRIHPRAPSATASLRARVATRLDLARGQARQADRACSSVPSPISNSEEVGRDGEIRSESDYEVEKQPHTVQTATTSRNNPPRLAFTGFSFLLKLYLS